MLTYEDVTAHFLKAATGVGLSAHPEHWTNARTLEREFACTCHIGSCEEAEQRGDCTLSFTWTTLDTALSLEGLNGVCDFFHEPDAYCPHLHSGDIPPLLIELSYSLHLNPSETSISEATLLSLAQILKLQASEHSSRTVETRSGVSMALVENRLQPDTLTLTQRVEIPIWHPEGMAGLNEYHEPRDHDKERRERIEFLHEHVIEEGIDIGVERGDEPHPEEWLPDVMVEICQDIAHVLNALDGVRTHGMLNME